jgi:ribonuclease HI
MREFWTDGSAVPNPGRGGYAVIEDGKPAALGGEENSTNIRMEGFAILAALDLAGGKPCKIHADSEFWINVLTKWAPGWERNGWKKKGGEIKNLELVQKIYKAFREGQAEFVWVRGHDGDANNELADEWANKAREGARL